MSERSRSNPGPVFLPEESVRANFTKELLGITEIYRANEEAEIASGARIDLNEVRKTVEFLREVEQEVIESLHGGSMNEKFPDKLTHVDRIPLSRGNLEKLSPILPSIKILFLYRNKRNESHLQETIPVLDGKTDPVGYWLEISYKRLSKISNFFIRDIVIKKEGNGISQ